MIIPVPYPLTLWLDADFALPFQWFDGPGQTNPHDITGYMLSASIKTAPGSTVPLLDFTIAITDAPNGKWVMSLTRSQLAVLSYKKIYWWDKFVTYPSSLLVDKLIESSAVTIKPNVTIVP